MLIFEPVYFVASIGEYPGTEGNELYVDKTRHKYLAISFPASLSPGLQPGDSVRRVADPAFRGTVKYRKTFVQVLIIEFKCNQGAEAGIKQIRAKGYDDKLKQSGKKYSYGDKFRYAKAQCGRMESDLKFGITNLTQDKNRPT